ncbi:MAG TPA: hypothetical protein VK499_14935 [Propionibacteriaceae bacterium]|nr:hypothetical protein [Propionibacteriaceae bacterium]
MVSPTAGRPGNPRSVQPRPRAGGRAGGVGHGHHVAHRLAGKVLQIAAQVGENRRRPDSQAWYAEATEDWLRQRLVAAEPTC